MADLGGLGSAIGGIAVLAGAGGQGGDRYRKQAIAVWQALKDDPNFDFSQVPAPVQQVFAEMFPSIYEEVKLGPAQTIADSAQGRGAQLRGLQQFEQIAQEGLPLGERLAAEEAQRTVGQEANRAREAVLEDLAQRGRLSAGDEIAGRMAAGSAAQNLAAGYGGQLAQQASQNRLAGIQGMAQAGESLRTGDINLAARNADILNRFNELSTQIGNERARYNAGAQERAQGYNVQTAQNVGTSNVQNKYAATLENLQRKNALKQQLYENALKKTMGLSGAYGGAATAADIERQNREKAIMQIGQGAGQTIGTGALGLGI